MWKVPLDGLLLDPLTAPHHSQTMSEEAWPPEEWRWGNPQEFSHTVSGLKNKTPIETAKGPDLLGEHDVLSYL